MIKNPNAHRVAILLAVAGLVPFVAMLGLLLMDNKHFYFSGLVSYGAIILSFLGAINWGIALAGKTDSPSNQQLYLWGVIPPLVAWSALIFQQSIGLKILIASYIIHLLVDRWMSIKLKLPTWYLNLRLGLSLSVTSILIAALYYYQFSKDYDLG